MGIRAFYRDTRHLWTLALLLGVVVAGFIFIRGVMVPPTFGDQGPYRAAVLDEIKQLPSMLISDATCLECHAEVGEEREGTLHQQVRCIHCHGPGREHVALARKAAKDRSVTLPSADEWDGDFNTKLDLYLTFDRAACLVCHESVVGMPADFKQINVAEHLEEQGAGEPDNPEVCSDCHGGHDTAP